MNPPTAPGNTPQAVQAPAPGGLPMSDQTGHDENWTIVDIGSGQCAYCGDELLPADTVTGQPGHATHTSCHDHQTITGQPCEEP